MDISIVPFRSSDISFGKTLTDMEQWHRTTEDWARLIRIEPAGAFKATLDGRDAGVAAVTSYGKLAWMHSVIVVEKDRGRGVGRKLVDTCINYCDSLGVRTLKIDAVPAAKEFYEKLDFVAEFDSLRLSRTGERGSALVQRMRPEDLNGVEAFDLATTRIDRTRVIREIYRDNPDWAFVARDVKGIRGYLLGRPCDVRINLGPCVCAPGTHGWLEKMVRSAMSTAPDKTFRVCVDGTNREALTVLRGMKFQETQPSTRMFLGERSQESKASYVMISPEKG